MGKSGLLDSTNYTPSNLYFSATSSYKTANPSAPATEHFDSSWSVAGVGALQSNYAGIIWVKNSTGDIGLTQFTNPLQPPYGNVIATLPKGSRIQGIGDYNGDGSVDLLFQDRNSGAASIWYLAWFGGNYYQPGPVLRSKPPRVALRILFIPPPSKTSRWEERFTACRTTSRRQVAMDRDRHGPVIGPDTGRVLNDVSADLASGNTTPEKAAKALEASWSLLPVTPTAMTPTAAMTSAAMKSSRAMGNGNMSSAKALPVEMVPSNMVLIMRPSGH